MANTITDNRTLLFDGGDGTGGAPDDLTGAATGVADTSTFLQGSNSYTISASNSLVGMMYDAGTAQNWAGNTFYLTVNSGVVGLMNSKATGGFRVRFCGATVTDFFEVYVGGSDSWPGSIQGGWTNFVVDIDVAQAAPDNTGGTPPATSAIRYVGIANLLGSMPKMADNTWLDTIHRLPANTPAVLIQGRNGGTTDWNSADILTQLGSGQMLFYRGPGGSYVLSGPIQVGINDTTTHGFTDTTSVWLWDNQEFIDDTLYGFSALGNAGGTTDVTLGVKTGTGATATGSQGLTILASSTGARWSMDFDDPNIDAIGFYGCSFQHGATFQLDDPAVEAISTLFIDCSNVQAANSLQQFNSYLAPDTLTNEAAVTTDDLADLVGNSFESGGVGHAVDLGTIAASATMSWDNTDAGYAAQGGTAGNRTILTSVASGQTLTINVSATATTPSYNNTGAGTVDVVAGQVTTTITVVDINTGSPIENANVYLLAGAGGPLTEGTVIIGTTTLTNASGVVTDTRSLASNQPVTGRARRASAGFGTLYKTSPISGTINSASGLDLTVQMIPDE